MDKEMFDFSQINQLSPKQAVWENSTFRSDKKTQLGKLSQSYFSFYVAAFFINQHKRHIEEISLYYPRQVVTSTKS